MTRQIYTRGTFDPDKCHTLCPLPYKYTRQMLSTVKKYPLNCFIIKIYSPTLTHSIFSENISDVSVLPSLLWLSNRSPQKLKS